MSPTDNTNTPFDELLLANLAAARTPQADSGANANAGIASSTGGEIPDILKPDYSTLTQPAAADSNTWMYNPADGWTNADERQANLLNAIKPDTTVKSVTPAGNTGTEANTAIRQFDFGHSPQADFKPLQLTLSENPYGTTAKDTRPLAEQLAGASNGRLDMRSLKERQQDVTGKAPKSALEEYFDNRQKEQTAEYVNAVYDQMQENQRAADEYQKQQAAAAAQQRKAEAAQRKANAEAEAQNKEAEAYNKRVGEFNQLIETPDKNVQYRRMYTMRRGGKDILVAEDEITRAGGIWQWSMNHAGTGKESWKVLMKARDGKEYYVDAALAVSRAKTKGYYTAVTKGDPYIDRANIVERKRYTDNGLNPDLPQHIATQQNIDTVNRVVRAGYTDMLPDEIVQGMKRVELDINNPEHVKLFMTGNSTEIDKIRTLKAKKRQQLVVRVDGKETLVPAGMKISDYVKRNPGRKIEVKMAGYDSTGKQVNKWFTPQQAADSEASDGWSYVTLVSDKDKYNSTYDVFAHSMQSQLGEAARKEWLAANARIRQDQKDYNDTHVSIHAAAPSGAQGLAGMFNDYKSEYKQTDIELMIANVGKTPQAAKLRSQCRTYAYRQALDATGGNAANIDCTKTDRTGDQIYESLVSQALYNEGVRLNMPQNWLEFLGRKVIDGNLVTDLIKGAARSAAGVTVGVTPAETAMANYGAEHPILDIGGTVLAFGADPTNLVGGFAAKGLTKLAYKGIAAGMTRVAAKKAAVGTAKSAVKISAETAARRLSNKAVGKFMLGGMLGGGGNFMGFEFTKNLSGQWAHGGVIDRDGQNTGYSLYNALQAAGHGFVLGSVTGVIKPYIGNVSNGLMRRTPGAWGKSFIHGVEYGGSSAIEGTIFALPEMYDENGNFEWDQAAWNRNFGMMLGFGAKHNLGTWRGVASNLFSRNRPGKPGRAARISAVFNARAFGYSTADFRRDIGELHAAGYTNLADWLGRGAPAESGASTERTLSHPIPGAESRKPVSSADIKADGGTPAVVINELKQALNDTAVSFGAANTAHYIVTGDALVMPTVTGYRVNRFSDSNKVEVTTLDSEGNAIVRRTYANEKAAEVYTRDLDHNIYLNSIGRGEQLYNQAAIDNRNQRLGQVYKNAYNDVAADLYRNEAADAAAERVRKTHERVKHEDEKASQAAGKRVKSKKVSSSERAIHDRVESLAREYSEQAGVDFVLQTTTALRADILADTGVDLERTLLRLPHQWTDVERQAVDRYQQQLYAGREAEAEVFDNSSNRGVVTVGGSDSQSSQPEAQPTESTPEPAEPAESTPEPAPKPTGRSSEYSITYESLAQSCRNTDNWSDTRILNALVELDTRSKQRPLTEGEQGRYDALMAEYKRRTADSTPAAESAAEQRLAESTAESAAEQRPAESTAESAAEQRPAEEAESSIFDDARQAQSEQPKTEIQPEQPKPEGQPAGEAEAAESVDVRQPAVDEVPKSTVDEAPKSTVDEAPRATADQPTLDRILDPDTHEFESDQLIDDLNARTQERPETERRALHADRPEFAGTGKRLIGRMADGTALTYDPATGRYEVADPAADTHQPTVPSAEREDRSQPAKPDTGSHGDPLAADNPADHQTSAPENSEHPAPRTRLGQEARRIGDSWSRRTGIQIVVHESPDTVTNSAARKAMEQGMNVNGWYEHDTRTVHIYTPAHADSAAVTKTYLHEILGHHGVRQLLGGYDAPAYKQFMEQVWDMMSDRDRAQYLGYGRGKNQPPRDPNKQADRVFAADEWLAHFAEGRSDINPGRVRDLWLRLGEIFRRALRRVGLRKNLPLSDAELADTLRRGYRNLRRNKARMQGGTADGTSLSVTGAIRGVGGEVILDRTDGVDRMTIRIGNKVFDAKNPVTVEALKENKRSVLNMLIEDSRDIAGTGDAVRENAYRAYASMLNVYLKVGNIEGMDVLMRQFLYMGDQASKPVSSNSDDQYSVSEDITRICKKNEAIIKALAELGRSQDYGFTPSQLIQTYLTVEALGYQAPCPVCYVFSRYIANGKYATALRGFSENYAGKLKDITTMTEDECTAYDKWWRAEYKRCQQWEADNKPMIETAMRDAEVALLEIDILGMKIMGLKNSKDPDRKTKIKLLQAQIDNISVRYQTAILIQGRAERSAIIKNAIFERHSKSKGGMRLRPHGEKLWHEEFYSVTPETDIARQHPGYAAYRASKGSAAGKVGSGKSDYTLGDIAVGVGKASDHNVQGLTGYTKDKDLNRRARVRSLDDDYNPVGISDYDNFYVKAANATNAKEYADFRKKARNAFKTSYNAMAAQNRRGGVRMWSWSDFIPELGGDMVMLELENSLLGAAQQAYSKQTEGVELAGKLGSFINGSLIAKGKGYETVPDRYVREIDGRMVDTRGQMVWDNVNNRPGTYYETVSRNADGKWEKPVFDPKMGIKLWGSIDSKGQYKLGLYDLLKRYDTVNSITVGMNDRHCQLILESDLFDFIIPYHKSGMKNHLFMQMYAAAQIGLKEFGYQDYEPLQGDKAVASVSDALADLWRRSEQPGSRYRCAFDRIPSGDGNGGISAEQREYRRLRAAILNPKTPEQIKKEVDKRRKEQADMIKEGANPEELYTPEELRGEDMARAVKKGSKDYKRIMADEFLSQLWNATQARGIGMTGKDVGHILPYEYWDVNSTRDTADVNGERYLEYCRRLGFKPKFCGIDGKGQRLGYGDFTGIRGYWKTLIDRRMYDLQGRYQDNKPITMERFVESDIDQARMYREHDITRPADTEGTARIVDAVLEAERRRLGGDVRVDYGMTNKQLEQRYARQMNAASKLSAEAGELVKRVTTRMEEIDKELKPYLSPDGSGFDLARADKKLPRVKALIEERNRLQDQINDALRLPSGKLATEATATEATPTEITPKPEGEVSFSLGENEGEDSYREPQVSFRILEKDHKTARTLDELPDDALVMVYRNMIVPSLTELGLASPMATTDPVTGQFRLMKPGHWNESYSDLKLTKAQQRALDHLEAGGELTPEMREAFIKIEKNNKGITSYYISDNRFFVIDSKGKSRFYFTLDKGKKSKSKWQAARENPYDHGKLNALNTQFKEAYNRPNMVLVRSVMPKSELMKIMSDDEKADAVYVAPHAKNSVGLVLWNNGEVLALSRWSKVIDVVTYQEYADLIDAEWRRHPYKDPAHNTIAADANVYVPQVYKLLVEKGWKFKNAPRSIVDKKAPYVTDDVIMKLKEMYRDPRYDNIINSDPMDHLYDVAPNYAKAIEHRKIGSKEAEPLMKKDRLHAAELEAKTTPIPADSPLSHSVPSVELEADGGVSFSLDNKKTTLTGLPNRANEKQTSGGDLQRAMGDSSSNAPISVEAMANLRNNTQSAKNKTKKFNNGDLSIRCSSFSETMSGIAKIINLRKQGRSWYNLFCTKKNRTVTIRLGDHIATGDNFLRDNTDDNLSIVIERLSLPYKKSRVKYTEVTIPIKAYEADPLAVVRAIAKGVNQVLDGAEFTIDPAIGTVENKGGDFDQSKPDILSYKLQTEDTRDVIDPSVNTAPSATPEAADDSGISFRYTDPRDGVTTQERVAAAERYNLRTASSSYQAREALQDSMLGLRTLYETIDRAQGRKRQVWEIEPGQNAYLAENRLSSTNHEEQKLYSKMCVEPISKAVAKLCNYGGRRGLRVKHVSQKERDGQYANLLNYMIARHGLERNELMRQNDIDRVTKAAIKRDNMLREQQVQQDIANGVPEADARQKWNQVMFYDWKQVHDDAVIEFGEKDYSGLTALTMDRWGGPKPDMATIEDLARTIVDEYHSTHRSQDIDDLWQAVNAATKATLTKLQESGLMTRSRMDEIADMYQYYIPLRGWAETTADEVYGYFHARTGEGSVMQTAKGRSSLADDPLATIAMMGERAIAEANRNRMKQLFFNYVRNNPSDLVSINRLWLKYDDTTDTWLPAVPDNINFNDSAAEIQEKWRKHEAKMRKLAKNDPDEKLYKTGRQAAEIPYILGKGELDEHCITVDVNGRTYIMTINGNPRAAQALNGLSNPDAGTGAGSKVFEILSKPLHWVAPAYTTRNPEFIMRNFMKDMYYANTNVWAKESPRYAWAFMGNSFMSFTKLTRLMYLYERGQLNMNKKSHQYFHEFMTNGGETGYTAMRNIKKHKADLRRMVNDNSRGITLSKALRKFGALWDAMNGWIENTARFATYVTSRNAGRSIERSIWDSKEISVNFNKKGAGDAFLGKEGQTLAGNAAALVAGSGRSLYVFWNATTQATTNMLRVAKHNPLKFTAWAATMAGLGFAIAMYHALQDEDDERTGGYFDQPEFLRRNNITFHIPGTDKYLKYALPHEALPFYAMGELIGSVHTGRQHFDANEVASELTNLLLGLTPLKMEGVSLAHALVPTAAAPLYEAHNNESWSGTPIYRASEYNEYQPEWTKAFSSANPALVAGCRALNELTQRPEVRGSEFDKGWLDLNPAKIDHMLKGYLGGPYTIVRKMINMGFAKAQGQDIKLRDIPFASAVMAEADERTLARNVDREYRVADEEYRGMQQRYRKYKSQAKDGSQLYGDIKADFEQSPDYIRYRMADNYDKRLKNLGDSINGTTDDNRRQDLERQRTQLRREMTHKYQGRAPIYTADTVNITDFNKSAMLTDVLNTAKTHEDRTKAINARYGNPNHPAARARKNALRYSPEKKVYNLVKDYRSDIHKLTDRWRQCYDTDSAYLIVQQMLDRRNRLINDTRPYVRPASGQ